MIRSIALAAAVVALILGVIAYSQYRQPPYRVSGIVEADEIRLGSRVGGRVAKVLVEEGTRVEAGKQLVLLEPFDLLEQESQAIATLALKQAAYDRLQAGYRSEEKEQAKARVDQSEARLQLLENGPRKEEIKAAKGRLDAAEAELTLAKSNFGRQDELFQQKAIAKAEFDKAVEQLKAANSQHVVRTQELAVLEAGAREEELAEARARLAEAESAWEMFQAGYRQEQIAEAKAARDAAQAALDAILQRKQELTIRSPIDGVVEALELQKGDLVGAGAPVLSIMDDARLWVRAYVPQGRLQLQVGQQLEVSLDSYPGERFAGEVSFISRQAEFTPSNAQTPEERSKQVVRIKVLLKSGAGKLRPGMTADVWLD